MSAKRLFNEVSLFRGTDGKLYYQEAGGRAIREFKPSEIDPAVADGVDLSELGAEVLAQVLPRRRTYSESTVLNDESSVWVDDDEAVAPVVLTLPPVSDGRFLRVKKLADTQTVTLTPASGLIDGAATFVLTTQHETVGVESDGTNWAIV